MKMDQSALESKAAIFESVDLKEKINSLADSVRSLLDRNQTIDEEIKSVKSHVDSMTYQIRQINVSPGVLRIFACKKHFYRKI